MVGRVNEIIRRLEENEANDNTVQRTALKRDSAKGKGFCASFGKVCNFKCCGTFLTSRPLAVLLACLYGLYLYYVITYGVLSSDRQMEDMPKDDPFGLRNETLNSEMLVVDCTSNFHTSKVPVNKTKVKIDVIWHKDWRQHVGIGCGGGFTLALGFGSIFSKEIRCSLTLVLPSLFAGRGRAMLLTIATGLIIDGPLRSINHNIQQIIRSITCMYEQMKLLSCQFQGTIFTILDHFFDALHELKREMEAQIREMGEHIRSLSQEAQLKAEAMKQKMENNLGKVMDAFNKARRMANKLMKVCGGIVGFFTFGIKRNCGKKLPSLNVEKVPGENYVKKLQEYAQTIKPDLEVADFNLDDLSSLIHAQDVNIIREDILNSIKFVFAQVEGVFGKIKKGFYIIPLFLLMVDAYRYMIKYQSDDTFDNMYIDSNLTSHEGEQLVPMRRWELAEKYQVSSSFKLSKKELQRIAILMIPSLIFITFTCTIFLIDETLRQFLKEIEEKAKWAISFQGMEQDLFKVGVNAAKGEVVSIKLEAFDLSTDPCLPHSLGIGYNSAHTWLIVIMVVCILSTFFSAYSERWRSQICNMFYPKRAEPRAKYLVQRIKAGRGYRRIHLEKLAMIDSQREKKVLEISPIAKIGYLLKKCFRMSTLTCHGCGYTKVKPSTNDYEEKQAVGGNGSSKVKYMLCSDCLKDLK